MIIGYKGFHKNLQGIEWFQYNVGETYSLDGELEICKNGFHYCKRLADLSLYFDLSKSRVCEVEILGNEVVDEEKKLTTDKIRIVRELSKEEINQYFEDNWEELIKDEDWEIRSEVVRHGVGLDKLVYDGNWMVREEVAKYGRPQDLDILVRDTKWDVRYAVAKHGRSVDLDILVHDNDSDVLLEVVKHGRKKDLFFLMNNDVTMNFSIFYFLKENGYKFVPVKNKEM